MDEQTLHSCQSHKWEWGFSFLMFMFICIYILYFLSALFLFFIFYLHVYGGIRRAGPSSSPRGSGGAVVTRLRSST